MRRSIIVIAAASVAAIVLSSPSWVQAGDNEMICEYGVQLIGQPTDASCWATSAVMVVGWRDAMSIPAETMVTDERFAWAFKHGLDWQDHVALAEASGLLTEDPQSFTVEAWARLLADFGPLWVAGAYAGSHGELNDIAGHAVVVAGIATDGTVEGTEFLIFDPWPEGSDHATGEGSSYWQTLGEFLAWYERVVRVQMADHSPDMVFQVLHSNRDDLSESAAAETDRCWDQYVRVFGDDQ